MIARIYKLLYELEDIWHCDLGLEGNYCLGYYLPSLLLSVIAYKRVCDVCASEMSAILKGDNPSEEEYAIAYDVGMMPYLFDADNIWDAVASADNKVDALKNAVQSLNTSKRRPNENDEEAIPVFYCQASDERHINMVLSDWFIQLETLDFGENSISDKLWLELMDYLYNRTRKSGF